jgi:hypothetical protein
MRDEAEKRIGEQVRGERRKTSGTAIESQGAGNLKHDSNTSIIET